MKKLGREIRRVSDLEHHPLNMEIYVISNLDDLKTNITENGLLQPLVINQENFVISGNRRLSSIRELGWETVSVDVVQTEKEDDLKYLIYSYNRHRIKTTEEIINEINLLRIHYSVGSGYKKHINSNGNIQLKDWRKSVSKDIGISTGTINNYLIVSKHPEYWKDIDDNKLSISGVCKLIESKEKNKIKKIKKIRNISDYEITKFNVPYWENKLNCSDMNRPYWEEMIHVENKLFEDACKSIELSQINVDYDKYSFIGTICSIIKDRISPSRYGIIIQNKIKNILSLNSGDKNCDFFISGDSGSIELKTSIMNYEQKKYNITHIRPFMKFDFYMFVLIPTKGLNRFIPQFYILKKEDIENSKILKLSTMGSGNGDLRFSFYENDEIHSFLNNINLLNNINEDDFDYQFFVSRGHELPKVQTFISQYVLINEDKKVA
jgi:ParB family chromosome partitioning protein